MSKDTIYFNGPSRPRCLLCHPGGSFEGVNLPLVIGLHGGGGSYEHFISLWDAVDEKRFGYAALEAPYAFTGEERLAYEWAMWPSGDREAIIEAARISQDYLAGAAHFQGKAHQTADRHIKGNSRLYFRIREKRIRGVPSGREAVHLIFRRSRSENPGRTSRAIRGLLALSNFDKLAVTS